MKGTVKLDNSHLELIHEDQYADVIDFIANQFIKDEPMFTAFDVKIQPYTDRLLWRLKWNISIMAVADETNEILGVFLCDVSKKGDRMDLNSLSDDNMRALFTFAKQKDFDAHDTVDLSELFHLGNLAVHRKCRRQGLGFVLFDSAVRLAKELGFKAISGEGSSNYSQKLFEKGGFELVLELPYFQYKYKGVCLSERTGEHTSLKIYLMLI